MIRLCIFFLLLYHGNCFLFSNCVDILPVICGEPIVQPIATRIVGGQEASIGSLPWVVALSELGIFMCSGAIISNRFVLTAAHCFGSHPSEDPLRWSALAGKHSLLQTNAGEVSYRVEKIILHPDYNNITGSNDIALLMLNESIIFTSLMMPVCLPSNQEIPDPGQACIVAGWGLTLDTGNFMLNQVTIPVISDDVCSQDYWHGDFFIPQQMFCAGVEEGGKDACMGDSGSPLTCSFGDKWFANGIVSIGRDCAVQHKPGIYTNVSHYVHWVQQTMMADCV